jgi:hypothetical protein
MHEIALPHLKKTKGSIINVGSTGGFGRVCGRIGVLRIQGGGGHDDKDCGSGTCPHGIRVNCICPGATKPVYDRHMIDVVIDRWDEFAKKLKDGKAPVSTIWFSER